MAKVQAAGHNLPSQILIEKPVIRPTDHAGGKIPQNPQNLVNDWVGGDDADGET